MTDSAQNLEPHVDLTGQTLGGYTVLRRLGRGGMADVYLARQESLDRNVALKVLKQDLARDKSYIERFQREAQSAAKLVQANIVGVYEVGEINGFHFIAQEYVVGRNLREYIARNGAVKPLMAVNILRQVALALQKASSHGVTHRDIKPENIMLSPSGEVKVADFGLARINDSTDKHLTQIGITMGTPLYMSPEQVEGQPVDVRSDIYSLGITAYHMLAGHPPFDGENALAIAVQHINSTPTSLTDIRPDVPDELIDIIKRMMSKNAGDRPTSAAQLIKELKGVKVDQDENWDELVETLAIESSPTLPDLLPESRLAATRQLQSVMRGNVQSWWTELKTVLGFMILMTTGIFTGLWFSNQYPISDPLGELARIEIKMQPTAETQYLFARDNFPASLEHYQAVIDLHPIAEAQQVNQTEIYHFKALERMAEIYLELEDYQSAIFIYQKFVNPEINQPRIKVVGHAGLAIAYFNTGQIDLSKNELSTIPNESEFLNQFLSQKLQQVRDQVGGGAAAYANKRNSRPNKSL